VKELSVLLEEARTGKPLARDQLFSELYGELRQLARAKLKRQPELTLLDTTVLVHESYLRLLKSGALPLQHKGQFMAYASQVMRSVIVDAVRERFAAQRGSGADHVPLDTSIPEPTDPRESEILGVHLALEKLAEVDARMVSVVEMRYFGGLNDAEVAEALGVSVRTVSREWEKARLFLAQSLL
jgi:RNA polymerase sigma factor (TIGR02999 family)